MEVSADVTFIRKRMTAFDRHTSRYRGKGKLIIDDIYVSVKGKRVHTPLMRVTLGVIFFLSLRYLLGKLTGILHIPSIEESLTIKAGIYTSLIIISFYLIEYVVLAREDFFVEFDAVRKFAYFTRAKFAAVSINELPRCSPVMFSSENLDEVIQALRKKIPEKEFRN
jgi:hypothetical protein